MSSVLQRKFLKKCRLKKEKFDLILGSLHRILHGTKITQRLSLYSRTNLLNKFEVQNTCQVCVTCLTNVVVVK